MRLPVGSRDVGEAPHLAAVAEVETERAVAARRPEQLLGLQLCVRGIEDRPVLRVATRAVGLEQQLAVGDPSAPLFPLLRPGVVRARGVDGRVVGGLDLHGVQVAVEVLARRGVDCRLLLGVAVLGDPRLVVGRGRGQRGLEVELRRGQVGDVRRKALPFLVRCRDLLFRRPELFGIDRRRGVVVREQLQLQVGTVGCVRIARLWLGGGAFLGGVRGLVGRLRGDRVGQCRVRRGELIAGLSTGLVERACSLAKRGLRQLTLATSLHVRSGLCVGAWRQLDRGEVGDQVADALLVLRATAEHAPRLHRRAGSAVLDDVVHLGR